MPTAPSHRTYRLDTAAQTLVLAAQGDSIASVVYWGPSLPPHEALSTLAHAGTLDVTGGMLDQNPELSVCPLQSRSFPGNPGILVRSQFGQPLDPRLVFLEAQRDEASLTLTYRDAALGLVYQACFRAEYDGNIIVATAHLKSEAAIYVEWLAAPVFPALQSSTETLEFSGKWIGEFQINALPWACGARVRNNRTGRSGHEHFPGLIVPARGCTNTQGQAQAFHYGWSGGHQMITEELSDGRRQVQFGHAPGTMKQSATSFSTAPLYCVCSDQGLNGCAVAFQRHLRDKIVGHSGSKAQRPRPVHYNCWEAVYFDHDIDRLKSIATQAAEIGAERFVLDDGWFKNRHDDTRALGDWIVDCDKYPNGLTPLIDHIKTLGLSFGIWFEPEMLNLDSDLFRAKPHWLLGSIDQIPGRQQYVLNMAMDEVQAYLFDRIAAILRYNDVEYIKWDHNRVLPYPDAAQTAGTYALLDRLGSAFPHVEIESCSSGGGRIDFGILSRTQRVWLSDSNDAIERMRIQHNAALFLPLSVTGSHVGPRRCHTSGRVIDMATRAWIAAQRHMGFEMDPRELNADERAILMDITAWWKANRGWMSAADILRLDSDDPAIIAEQQLAIDGSQFVVFAGSQDTRKQIAPRPLRLTRLDPRATYLIVLRNRDDAHHLSRGNQSIKTRALTLSGQYLMSHGLALPWSFPQKLWVIEGAKTDADPSKLPQDQ